MFEDDFYKKADVPNTKSFDLEVPPGALDIRSDTGKRAPQTMPVDGIAVLCNNYEYRLRFMFDCNGDTYCTLMDVLSGFPILSGHTLYNPADKYDMVLGMKIALERALDSPPVFFDKQDRAEIWEAFWRFTRRVYKATPKEAALVENTKHILTSGRSLREVSILTNLFNLFPQTT